MCALLAGLGFSVMAAPPAKLLERDSVGTANPQGWLQGPQACVLEAARP